MTTLHHRMSTRGIIFGSLASLCFGAGIVVNKVGLAQSALHPLEYTALSVMVAGILGGVVIVPQRAALYSCSWLCILNILFLGITASVISYVFLFWGQSLTKAINAGFLISLSGFFTVLFASPEDVLSGICESYFHLVVATRYHIVAMTRKPKTPAKTSQQGLSR